MTRRRAIKGDLKEVEEEDEGGWRGKEVEME